MTFLTGQLIARKKKKTTLFYREEQCRVSHLTIYYSEAFILAILLLVIQIANTHTHTHTHSHYVLVIALRSLHILNLVVLTTTQ